MNTPENILIQFDCDSDEAVDPGRLQALLAAVCREFEAPDAQVQVSIVDDAQMSRVHRQYLNDDSPTDVMSFDLSDAFEPAPLYQLIVNIEQAARQARQRGHSTEAELALYMTHGLLHQLGFDDRQPEAAQRMHETEDAILQRHGFGVIYHKNEP